jgi:hypothetical protein
MTTENLTITPTIINPIIDTEEGRNNYRKFFKLLKNANTYNQLLLILSNCDFTTLSTQPNFTEINKIKVIETLKIFYYFKENQNSNLTIDLLLNKYNLNTQNILYSQHEFNQIFKTLKNILMVYGIFTPSKMLIFYTKSYNNYMKYLIDHFGVGIDQESESKYEILNGYIRFLHSLVKGEKDGDFDIGLMSFEEMCDSGFIRYEIIMMFINSYKYATNEEKIDEYESLVSIYELHCESGIID